MRRYRYRSVSQRSSVHPFKTSYRVVVVYTSQDDRRMEMWSHLMTQVKATKLADKWKKMGHPHVSIERFGNGGYEGARKIPYNSWCQELP